MKYQQVEVADVDRLHIEWQERLSSAHHGIVSYNKKIAFAPPSKLMQKATVALASTAGAHLADQAPFDMENRKGDMTARYIPGDTPISEIVFTHDHTDHSDADVDPNCLFPLERLWSFKERGIIGAVSSIHASASGFMPDPTPFVSETIPEIIDQFKEAKVDVVLLTPG
jgi:D-proline reductase (dithiol) PrdB